MLLRVNCFCFYFSRFAFFIFEEQAPLNVIFAAFYGFDENIGGALGFLCEPVRCYVLIVAAHVAFDCQSLSRN